MKRMLPAVLAIALTLGGVASAQIDPTDTGAGDKVGMQELNNSGQIGSVTLFGHGATTSVVIAIDGVPGGKVQAATIHRGKDCDTVDPKAVVRLTDLKGGRGRTIVKMPESRLMSDNYSVLVYANTNPNAHAVSCGHLYH